VEDPETNLVFFDTTGTGMNADDLADRARDEGVMISTMGRYRARACTHLDVDAAGIALAVEVLRHVSAR
jgi:threonine aldolase